VSHSLDDKGLGPPAIIAATAQAQVPRPSKEVLGDLANYLQPVIAMKVRAEVRCVRQGWDLAVVVSPDGSWDLSAWAPPPPTAMRIRVRFTVSNGPALREAMVRVRAEAIRRGASSENYQLRNLDGEVEEMAEGRKPWLLTFDRTEPASDLIFSLLNHCAQLGILYTMEAA